MKKDFGFRLIRTVRKNLISEKAFTLIELLIVISILGVLATIGLVAFRSAQFRGRDAQRKSDLKQISSALELYFSDYGRYPTSSSGLIMGCPSTTQSACNWGSGPFWDQKTTYFKVVPKDPANSQNYYYKADSTAQKFQLFAHLENSQDINCLPNLSGKSDCAAPKLPTAAPNCGSSVCNFAITSPNTTPTDF